MKNVFFDEAEKKDEDKFFFPGNNPEALEEKDGEWADFFHTRDPDDLTYWYTGQWVYGWLSTGTDEKPTLRVVNHSKEFNDVKRLLENKTNKSEMLCQFQCRRFTFTGVTVIGLPEPEVENV